MIKYLFIYLYLSSGLFAEDSSNKNNVIRDYLVLEGMRSKYDLSQIDMHLLSNEGKYKFLSSSEKKMFNMFFKYWQLSDKNIITKNENIFEFMRGIAKKSSFINQANFPSDFRGDNGIYFTLIEPATQEERIFRLNQFKSFLLR